MEQIYIPNYMIMKTINTTPLEVVNNIDYGKDTTTNKYAEAYKNQALEILNNPNTTFSKFVDEQSTATDITRLGGLKQGAMLKEQLKFLGIKSFSQELVNNVEENTNTYESSINTAPNGGYGLKLPLGGFAA